MTDLLLPAGIIAISLAMTYFFCVRPMRRGRCAHPSTKRLADDELDLALQHARTEVERLRAQPPRRV